MEGDKSISTNISPKNQDLISYFEKDIDFVFAYKKTEKLASAIYMVTNLFSENEPMKWTLRKKVSELVSFVLKYKDVAKTSKKDFIYSVKTQVLEVVSLLEVSLRGGIVSEMNFTVLKQEFLNLISIFEESLNSRVTEVFQDQVSAVFGDKDIKNTIKDNTHSVQMSNTLLKDSINTQEKDVFKRTNRQNIILGLLKKKKDLTIKDISLVIKDCSEKTIQRELISFIKAGVLKKTGERRWSKYSLNTPSL